MNVEKQIKKRGWLVSQTKSMGTAHQGFVKVKNGENYHATIKLLELAKECAVNEEIIDYFAKDVIKKFSKYLK